MLHDHTVEGREVTGCVNQPGEAYHPAVLAADDADNPRA